MLSSFTCENLPSELSSVTHFYFSLSSLFWRVMLAQISELSLVVYYKDAAYFFIHKYSVYPFRFTNFNCVIDQSFFGLQHHAKNKKCFVCNQPTLGIFNTALEIRKKMSAEGK